MVYVKLNADFVSVDKISEVTEVSRNRIEEFVNRGMQFANVFVDQYLSTPNTTDRKLRFFFDIDELGLDDDVKRLLMMSYESKPVDADMYVAKIKDVLYKYQVKDEVSNRVLEWVETDLR